MATSTRPYDQLFPTVAAEGRVVDIGARLYQWKASSRRWSRLPVEGESAEDIYALGPTADAFHTFIHETLPGE